MATNRTPPQTGEVQRRYTRESDVERVFGINRRTLQKWRLFGKGPRFYRAAGRVVLYNADEVDRWIRSECGGDDPA